MLVDGHSVDDTIAVARQCRPDIKIVTQPGTGKGDALLAGFAACTGDIIVMMDGDGSTEGSEIARFVGALVAGADYAKGSRFTSSGGSDDITPARRLGNRMLSGLVNLAFGTRYTDLCYGYNAFWAKHLPALNLDCNGFEIETLMNIRAAKAALRVQEIPSHEQPRVHGESNLRVFFDGWRILKAITAEAIAGPRRRPSGDGRPPSGTGCRRARRRRGQRRTRPWPPSLRGPAHAGHDLGGDLRAYARTVGRHLRRGRFGAGAELSLRREIIVVVDHNPELHAAR